MQFKFRLITFIVSNETCPVQLFLVFCLQINKIKVAQYYHRPFVKYRMACQCVLGISASKGNLFRESFGSMIQSQTNLNRLMKCLLHLYWCEAGVFNFSIYLFYLLFLFLIIYKSSEKCSPVPTYIFTNSLMI
jgi:hypothetical protein